MVLGQPMISVWSLLRISVLIPIEDLSFHLLCVYVVCVFFKNVYIYDIKLVT